MEFGKKKYRKKYFLKKFENIDIYVKIWYHNIRQYILLKFVLL